MKNILLRFLSTITHPKRYFDQIISGPGAKQFVFLLLFFVILWSGLFGVSFILRNDQSVLINNQIPNRGWSILAQMVDPGNQHMVGVGDNVELNTDSTIYKNNANLKDICSKRKSEIPTIQRFDWKLRIFVFIVSFLGTLAFSGLLISTFSNIFERRIDKIKEGLINYRFRNHFVVIGFDQMAVGLIKQLLLKDKLHYVVLHSIQNIPDVRKSLFSQLTPKERRRVIFLHGSRDLASEMKRLCLKRSKEIYILGEPDEYDHDSRNIECYKNIDSLLKQKSKKVIDCHMMFENPTTFTAFQFMNFEKIKDRKTNLRSFNFYENWAERVLVPNVYSTSLGNKNTLQFLTFDYERIKDNPEDSVHFVIIGMSRMGIALGIEAARLFHFANFEKKKTRITFIDDLAEEKECHFANCYSSFYNSVDIYREQLSSGKKSFKQGNLPFIDIELEFISGRVESPSVREKLSEWADNNSTLLKIAVCFNDPSVSLSAGMYLPRIIYDRKIQVLVMQKSSLALVNILSADLAKVDNRYAELKPFGMLNDCFDLDLYDEHNAKSVNHYYWNCDHINDQITFTLDEINKDWKDLKERDRWSNRYNAHSFGIKLKTISWDGNSQLSDEQVELLARMEHARWNVERLIAGFIPANPLEIKLAMQSANLAWEAYINAEKDHANEEYKKLKTIHENEVNLLKSDMCHPCIIPFDDLSEYYKNIDRQLVRSIPKILKSNAKLSS